MKKPLLTKTLLLLLILPVMGAMAACAGEGVESPAPIQTEPAQTPAPQAQLTLDEQQVAAAFIQEAALESFDIQAELIPLADKPAQSSLVLPTASGTLVKSNSNAVIDYSNTADGYVMIKYVKATQKKIKVQIKGPSATTYTYNLAADSAYDVFPLSDGNGGYTITVFENVSGTSYSTAASLTTQVTLKDEFAPFLLPNQYVDYSAASAAVAKAAEIVGTETDQLKKVQLIYTWVIGNLSYDYDLAKSVTSGYLPNLDQVLTKQKGICFDYASLMTAMLRSQGIPTKLVVGYSGKVYHAWLNTYVPEVGWVNGVIYFDGAAWKLMDPTFASTSKQSQQIMDYIGNGANYTAKYLY